MKCIKILMSVILIASSVNAQIMAERKYDPDKLILKQIEQAAQSKYRNDYEVNFHIMDSLIAHSRRKKIIDPYGTLNGCILFSAWPKLNTEDSVVTGMYKNGKIIWDDYPGTKAGFGGKLFATLDLNNDSTIEILQSDSDLKLRTREGSGVSYLWILSWNGKTGKMINDIDSISHQSSLVSTDGVYDLNHIDQRGIIDIQGELDELWQNYFPRYRSKSLPKIVYKWNGQKYIAKTLNHK